MIEGWDITYKDQAIEEGMEDGLNGQESHLLDGSNLNLFCQANQWRRRISPGLQ